MIQKKSFMMALKRAFQTGTFNYVGQQATCFPSQLCRIQELQIDDQNWWQCNPITKIDVSNNCIPQLPEQIIVLADIQLIRMKNNLLTSIPKSLIKLQNLKSLDISKNKLISLPVELSNFPSLVEINFSENSLEYIPDLDKISTLQFVIIDRNKIKELPRMGVQIKKVQAASNQIKQLRKKHFQLSHCLEHLNLDKNVIQYIQKDSFINAKNLVSLQLKENKLQSFSQVPNSQKLDTINLGFNRLKEYDHFDKCPNLTVLILSDNKIKSISKDIIKLKKLKTLDLSNNDLPDLPCQIGFINSLVRIQVQGNPLKSIRQNIKTGGTNIIKKYLQQKMDVNQRKKIEQKVLNSFEKSNEGQYWVKLIQEFCLNGQLVLRGLNLIQISPIVFQKTLKGLNLSQNKIRHLSQDIINFQTLNYLILNNNQLQELPKNLSRLPILSQIQAKHNYLTNFISSNNKNPFPHLHHLDLSTNKIKQFPKSILQIPKLRTLYLGYNILTDVQCLWNPNYLHFIDAIDLSNNKIQEISDNVCKKQSLNYLNIQNNNLTKLPTVLGFMKLSGLKIDGNPLKLIKRQVIQKGTVAILEYLRTKHSGQIPQIREKMPYQKPVEVVEEEKEPQIKLNSKKQVVQPKNQQTQGEKQKRISQIQAQMQKLQREIDENMGMNTIQKNERKRKIQALMIQKNKLLK